MTFGAVGYHSSSVEEKEAIQNNFEDKRSKSHIEQLKKKEPNQLGNQIGKE